MNKAALTICTTAREEVMIIPSLSDTILNPNITLPRDSLGRSLTAEVKPKVTKKEEILKLSTYE